MSFYASPEFLQTAAAVYYPGRPAEIQDVRIGDEVFRLLVVDGRKIVTRLLFLDYHQPLAKGDIKDPVRKGRSAHRVSRGVVDIDNWQGGDEESLAPFVDWTKFSSFEAYREFLLSRHRGLIRDRERRARGLQSRFGDLVMTVDDTADDVLAMARQWKGRQLSEIGLPDYFEDPRSMNFLKALRERGQLVCTSLRAGGRLVSVWIGFIHQGSWSGWIFTYDPELRKYSAGYQLLSRMLQTSYELGHHEFDFSVGAQDYKMQYATHGRILATVGTPSLARSAVCAARDLLREASPDLFAAALRAKWLFNSAFRRTPALSMPKATS